MFYVLLLGKLRPGKAIVTTIVNDQSADKKFEKEIEMSVSIADKEMIFVLVCSLKTYRQ
jgi:hypothetical protein